jgi:hypothetical protein
MPPGTSRDLAGPRGTSRDIAGLRAERREEEAGVKPALDVTQGSDLHMGMGPVRRRRGSKRYKGHPEGCPIPDYEVSAL